MDKNLNRIKRIVIVMMENRSFDHMLGYLAFPEFGHPLADQIDGVPQAIELYREEHAIFPKTLQSPVLNPDPPHERTDIANQIADGLMNGFVTSYLDYFLKNRNLMNGARIDGVMEYCTPHDIPTTDFLARNFTICDRWFSSLPASTLPNRLFAGSGYSMRDVTPFSYFDAFKNIFGKQPQPLLFNWLSDHNVSWHVYHGGMSFYTQWKLTRPLPYFFDYSRFAADVRGDLLPMVTFIEPQYQDDPERSLLSASGDPAASFGQRALNRIYNAFGIQSDQYDATDDHPPASISGGQRLLKQVYSALAASPNWQNTLMVVLYDEHGSFFDHVAPPYIPAAIPAGAAYQVPTGFVTTGVRVPAIVISPFVKAGGVCHTVFDHTSLLKMLAEKYNGGSFNPEVDARPFASLSEVLDDELLASTDPVRPPPPLT